MNFSFWNRKIHYYLSIAVLLPLFITSATGILLIFRHHSETIQPQKISRPHKEVSLNYPQIAGFVAEIKHPEVTPSDSIKKVVLSPSKGLIEVFLTNDIHIQLDGKSGEVLKIAPRYTTLLIKLHEGIFFHKWVRDGIFLPMSLLVFILLITGGVLVWEKLFPRRRVKKSK